MKRLSLALAALTLSTPTLADTPTDAVAKLMAAMGAGDAAAVEAAFTDDAGYAYSLEGGLTRGEGFDAWVASDITGPKAQFVIESATETDTTLDALVLWGRGGSMTSPARYVFAVKDGKIDSWLPTWR